MDPLFAKFQAPEARIWARVSWHRIDIDMWIWGCGNHGIWCSFGISVVNAIDFHPKMVVRATQLKKLKKRHLALLGMLSKLYITIGIEHGPTSACHIRPSPHVFKTVEAEEAVSLVFVLVHRRRRLFRFAQVSLCIHQICLSQNRNPSNSLSLHFGTATLWAMNTR